MQTPSPSTVDSKGLKPGALGLVGSVVVGMASTAPASSLAASLGFVVTAGAGLKGPAIMLLAIVPMYFIAIAYRDLNEAEPDLSNLPPGRKAVDPKTSRTYDRDAE